MNFTPGCLVNVRGRDWVVQPSDDPELLLLKPLGGSDEETTGIFLPLELMDDRPKTTAFSMPEAADLGNLQSARLLYDSARLSFRNGAGPFRALAKLSFRPRAYQMVPLVMALRLDPVRLLVADDVGVGKTVEALLILRELLERRAIRRFAVICLPHLCDQWQEEIQRKLDLEAVVIRSSTQARLDREIQGDTSVFEHYPYQVVSIDYIKQESRRDTFLHQCPELVIVDEVHACACPAGAPVAQQQRHALLRGISARKDQHLILLTATPHSGKPEEFQSLLGLLRPEFSSIDLSGAVTEAQRRDIAAHFIQRRRADVEQWASERTTFAERDPKEIQYDLAAAQLAVFDQTLDFARSLVTEDAVARRRRVSYWTALALLRGVASSPAAGAAMLRARLERLAGDDLPDGAGDTDAEAPSPVHDQDLSQGGTSDTDVSPVELMQEVGWSDAQKRRLSELASRLDAFAAPGKDAKLAAAARIVADNLSGGFNTVIFCRYIATARYLGEHLPALLKKAHGKARIEVVTSEDPDELRRSRIEDMADAGQRILIATDCLSEGINLQDLFSAVLHYDLPWNPNRLEQREGRVDRYGQTAPVVRATLLYGRNPVDGIVLDVILKKIREIRRSTGVAIAFPEDSRSIMDSVAQAVLFSPSRARAADTNQLMLELDTADETRDIKLTVSRKIEEAERRDTQSRSIFRQHGIKADELERDLHEADEFIGSPAAVEEFVSLALALLGAELAKTAKGHRLHTTNLPETLKAQLPPKPSVLVSFESPTPDGYLYLGRNHAFVEQLCHLIMRNTLDRDHGRGASRAAVIRSADVREKHTIYLCRCRNVIAHGADRQQIVAEEMLLWGYAGYHKDGKFLDHATAKKLLADARASQNIAQPAAAAALSSEIEDVFPDLRAHMDAIGRARGTELVDAHHRFSRLLKERARYQVVEPVLPMDVLGVYVILPEVAR